MWAVPIGVGNSSGRRHSESADDPEDVRVDCHIRCNVRTWRRGSTPNVCESRSSFSPKENLRAHLPTSILSTQIPTLSVFLKTTRSSGEQLLFGVLTVRSFQNVLILLRRCCCMQRNIPSPSLGIGCAAIARTQHQSCGIWSRRLYCYCGSGAVRALFGSRLFD